MQKVFKAGFALASLTALVAVPQLAQAASYSVTDLGVRTGDTYSYGYGISSDGRVAGAGDWNAIATPTGTTSFRSMGLLAGGSGSLAYGVNCKGSVAGIANGTNSAGQWFDQHAIVTTATATMVDLGLLPGGSYSQANAINDAGIVVGYADMTDQQPHAFISTFLKDGQKTLSCVPLLAHGTYNLANAVNSLGHVTGCGDTPYTLHTFIFKPATATTPATNLDLGAPKGYNNTVGYGINDTDQVTGYFDLSNGSGNHAFLYTPGTGYKDLGTLTAGYDAQGEAINNAGTVVGFGFYNNWSVLHAFVYTPASGKMVDLNTLIPANTGWLLQDAHAINANGWITGYGTIGGKTHAFLLKPTN